MNDKKTAKPRILIVDDDQNTVEAIQEFFQSEGFEVYTAYFSQQALDLLLETPVDIVLTGVNQPGMSGLELTKIIKEKYDIEVIIFTGYVAGCSPDTAENVGAFRLLYKPVQFIDLLNVVKRALKKRNLNSIHK
jgi:two-component system, cell cycle response regulator